MPTGMFYRKRCQPLTEVIGMVEVVVISCKRVEEDKNYLVEVALDAAVSEPWPVRFPVRQEVGSRVKVRI